jgi:Ca2+/H+ antiporter, TMEM165/GDT1 family
VSVWFAYLTVFVAAAIPWLEVLLVVPAGIVAGLAPVPTAMVGAVGNAASLVPLVFAGDRLRAWWRSRRSSASSPGRDTAVLPEHELSDGVGTTGRHPGQDATGRGTLDDGERTHESRGAGEDDDEAGGRGQRARQVYDRFGLPGLALLGPLLTGVHVAALVGLAAGSSRRPTLAWLLGGVALWAALAAGATVFGLDALVDPDALPELFAATR